MFNKTTEYIIIEFSLNLSAHKVSILCPCRYSLTESFPIRDGFIF